MGYSFQGPGEEGYSVGRSLDLVESVSRVPKVEAPKAPTRMVPGMKLFPQMIVLLPFSLFLASPYFLGALQAWGISMGMRLWGKWNR